MTPWTWARAKYAAARKVADQYGLSDDVMQSIGVIMRSPTLDRATDPKMDARRQASDISRGFDTNAQVDRATPSLTPEPGVVQSDGG